ncbi:MAG: hypothetical protein HYZ28_04200 [Myxococcales bacterium]|nr:hypothetical protein [Myxococcales bacterium]
MRFPARGASLALAFVAMTAQAQVSTVGDVVIVADPNGTITNQMWIPGFCREAFNAVRAGGFADIYDGIFAFSAYEGWNETQNTWYGAPVRYTAQGIGRSGTNLLGQGFNSSKLSQCVFMGTLGSLSVFPGFPPHEPLPPNPDDLVRAFGLFSGQTGVEMLGHEYGHHWLMGVEFDRNDGLGKRHFIRGCEGGSDPSQPCDPNQHYSALADSHSVMYGSFVTDLGGGSFKLEGGVRRYGLLDQYLMGLRAPTEVPPMMIVDPGTGEGDPSQPLPKGSSRTATGTRVDVAVEDVVRAMGTRVPAYPSAQSCWRVAFVVVLAPGQTSAPPAMLQKVEAYRKRWGPWFSFATDARGTMDTRLSGAGCIAPPTDGGTVVQDAGTVPADAGVADSGVADAGTEPVDAGSEPGNNEPPVQPATDGGNGPSKWETLEDTGKLKPGCGCGAAVGANLLALAAAMLLLRRRRIRP